MSSPRVLRDIESPPGGWRLTVPHTGMTFTSLYAKSLKSTVKAHLLANEHEIPDDFDEWFEEAACLESGHGEPWCGDMPPTLTKKQKLITPSKAKRFMRTAIALLQDRKLVNREEAERRAEICRGCPAAGEIGGCWGCYAIYRKIRRILKDSPISFKKEKRFCMPCGCLLKAKVWIPNDTLDKAEEGDRPEYAKGCWRDEASPPSSDPGAP